MTYKSPFPDVEIPNVSLPDYLFENISQWPEKPALIDGPTGRAFTYLELQSAVRSVATGLSVGNTTYQGTTAPSNGAIIGGSVGSGTTGPDGKLHI